MNRLRYNQTGVSPPLSIRNSLRLAAHIQMLPVLESGEETLVGGQAVMEGVMMRAPHSYCVAVRKARRRNRHGRSRWPKCPKSTRYSDTRCCAGWALSVRRCRWDARRCGFRPTPRWTKAPGQEAAEDLLLGDDAESALLLGVLHFPVQVRSAVARRLARQRLPRSARPTRDQPGGRRHPHGDLPRLPVR